MNFIDLTDQRFGRLVALRDVRRNGLVWWECMCDCGTPHTVNARAIRSGDSRSCGCLQRELVSERASSHGLTATPEYVSWVAMRTRCNNPRRINYKDYGGRGIKICAAWDSFDAFLADMGPRPNLAHSIERRDVNGDYCPENCYWATRIVQARNTRVNRLVEYGGETIPLAEAVERAGLPYFTVHGRLRRGWSTERALSEPVQRAA